nr:hypothetical protein Itr_chr02CG14410 [Ipomoea trifida]
MSPDQQRLIFAGKHVYLRIATPSPLQHASRKKPVLQFASKKTYKEKKKKRGGGGCCGSRECYGGDGEVRLRGDGGCRAVVGFGKKRSEGCEEFKL